MKYKEIIKIIKNISLALPDVQSFYTGDVYEVNADQSVKYSSVVLTNQEHSFDNINDKFQYNFILFYIDRLTDDEANRTDVHTAAVSALKNIVRHLEDYNVIINDFKFNLFRERFNDSCAGAYATLSVDVEDNDCNDGFDFGQISPDKLKEISITSNGTYTPDEGYYYTKIDVNVPIPEPKLGSLVATENDKWYMASNEGLDGYDAVNVSVPMPKLIDHTAIYVENGSYTLTPSDADGYSSVAIRVNVPNPSLTVLNATENGHYEAVDSGFYGYSAVEVNVPTPTFETSELVATENGIYRASEQGVDGFYAVMVDVNQTVSSKVVVPNGIKFSNSSAVNSEDFDVSQVSDMSYMFKSCYHLPSLDLSTWDVSNVTNMYCMFNYCSSLTSLDLSNWNVSNVTNMGAMFDSCGLTSLDLSNWNAINATDISAMFQECSKLISLDLSNWDMSNVTDMYAMFYNCKNLTDLNMTNAILPKNNLNFGLSTCTALTIVSLESVLNALPQLSEGESYTCSLGSTNLAKLTDTQIAIATNKGWTLS